jgi:predicted short-subunit dehydrogenase-like oxidoreductase (DUF2520 family)
LGRGNLGRSLERAFRAAGYSASLVPGHTALIALPSSIVFVAVPDRAVAEVAARIARTHPSTRVSFVHVSGSLGLGALDALRDHAVGSFHPLQSFPEPRGEGAFRGITVAVDASTPTLMRRLRAIARAIGARPKQVEDRERALYHAAAVFASNYVDVVLAKAVDLLRDAGWSEKAAIEGLLPLTEGVLANVRKRGPVAALTGPVRRGDVSTVEGHLAALRGAPVADLYRMLGLIALEIAKEAGLEPVAARRMQRALTQKAAATRRRRGA